jgi:hypothetical protein
MAVAANQNESGGEEGRGDEPPGAVWTYLAVGAARCQRSTSPLGSAGYAIVG